MPSFASAASNLYTLIICRHVAVRATQLSVMKQDVFRRFLDMITYFYYDKRTKKLKTIIQHRSIYKIHLKYSQYNLSVLYYLYNREVGNSTN